MFGIAQGNNERLFLRLCLATWALLTALSLLRHVTFHSSLYDLGIFHQVLWNTAHGRPFASSIKHMSYLGDHFSPSLALLAPLEWLPFPIVSLLAAHAAATAFTGYNIYYLARRHLDERTAFLIGCGTLYCPALYCPTLADIHPEAFMAAALSRALLELDRDRVAAAALCVAIALGGKEDSGLLIGPLGVVMAIDKRHRVFGVLVAIAGFAWTPLAVFVLMPAFRPQASAAAAATTMATGEWFYLNRYSHLGDSMSTVAKFVILHPVSAVLSSLTVRKVVTLALLALSFGLAPLRGGARLLCTVPFAAAHYLSSRWTQFFFPFHYLAPMVPVLAWAAMAGAQETIAKRPRASAVMVFLVAAFAVVWRFDPEPLLPRPERAALSEAMALVPDDAPVCVENWFGAQLSARREIEFCVLWEWERAQYGYFGWPESSSAPWQLFDLHDPNGDARDFPSLAARLAALRAAGAQVVFDRDGVTLLHVDAATLARAK